MYLSVRGKQRMILEIVPNLERYSAEVLREISNYRIGMQITIQDVDEMLTGIAQAAAFHTLKLKHSRQVKENQLSMFILMERPFFTRIKWLEHLLKQKQEEFYG